MDLNFEEFSFSHGDILKETEGLSEKEKIEFLVGYVKELTDSYSKLFRLSTALFETLSQSKQLAGSQQQVIEKLNTKIDEVDEMSVVHGKWLTALDKHIDLHARMMDIVNERIEILDKRLDTID